MAIKSKIRKMLWAKSGNRCAICKIELFLKKHPLNDLNIGEECHIISSKKKGPRFKPDLKDYDRYSNFLLLCRNHHKEIDELVDTYTEELLRYLKTNHENWVQRTLNQAAQKESLYKPKFLTKIDSGKELLDIIWECYGHKMDFDKIKNEEESEFIGGVFQEIVDYTDLSGMGLEIYDKVKISVHLNDILETLDEKGYSLFGERALEKIKFADGKFDNWDIATLIIKRKESNDILNFVKNNKF